MSTMEAISRAPGTIETADGPPRRGPSPQEAAAPALLAAAEARAEPGDGGQAGQEGRRIEVAHKNNDF